MERKLDLREGLPLKPKEFAAGTMLMLVPGGKWSRCWEGCAYIYHMVECPACGKVSSEIFASKPDLKRCCHHCGWDSDEEGEFKEPAVS
jgi:hypothetical protein